MRKWTTTTVGGQPCDIGSVTLTQVLNLKESRLNPVECLALLSQTGSALQDVLLGLNGRRQRLRRASSIATSTGLSSRNRDITMATIHPRRVLCTTTGRVVLSMTPTNDVTYLNEFLHPEISKRSSNEVTEIDLEVLGIYSLAKTIAKCLTGDHGEQTVRNILDKMTSGSVTSLLLLIKMVNDEWAKLVGASPVSRFVAQICRRTQGWNSGLESMPVSQPVNPVLPPKPKREDEDIEIEFSRMDSNNSSSSSLTSASPQPTAKPLCSSSPLNNKEPKKATTVTTGHYGRRLDYRPMKLEPSPKKRKAVERNPSRLYRVVRPLAEIAAAPMPATKRCVGPEFVVMGNEDPVLLDLYVHRSRKEEGCVKNVTIVMLNGQRISVRCNAATVTAGEILDAVLRDRDIKEGSLFTLSCMNENGTEYWALSNETKLSKIAPVGWKEGRACRDLTLYQRFRFHPDDVDRIKDGDNKHQLYLQLRRDLLEARINGLTQNMYLSLAGMALQVEFGDFSEDIHGDDEYFMLEHYLPNHMLLEGRESSRKSLVKVHRAHLGQSQSKTEMKFCREIQRLENFGFHFFSVAADKKSSTSLASLTVPTNCLLGIHVQGIFMYERARDILSPHKLLAPLFWRNIGRIQYDKTRFQITLTATGSSSCSNNNNNTNKEDSKSHKLKFQVSELKAKLMFELSSCHHQHSNKLRYQSKQIEEPSNGAANAATTSSKEMEISSAVEYREPPRERAMRSLKNKFLSRRQLTQKKLYTQQPEAKATASTAAGKGSLKRSSTTNYLIKRLTHYSSMADNLVVVSDKKDLAKAELNTSDKENKTPEGAYRYKVYLEPEEDDHPERISSPIRRTRVPLQEKPISSLYPELATSMTRLATNPVGRRRRSESLARPVPRQMNPMASARSVTTRKTTKEKEGGSVLRMGTRISLSALHRERLRLTSELGLLPAPPSASIARKLPFDLDSYDLMEAKSILPTASEQQQQQQQYPVSFVFPSVESCEPMPYQLNESLSESLIERFDNMETEGTEPERQIVSVIIVKDAQGRLGLKITGTPSGIYVEDFESGKVHFQGPNRLHRGDRIVAINGRSLENVSYAAALELVRRSGHSVQFLVSQIKN